MDKYRNKERNKDRNKDRINNYLKNHALVNKHNRFIDLKQGLSNYKRRALKRAQFRNNLARADAETTAACLHRRPVTGMAQHAAWPCLTRDAPDIPKSNNAHRQQ